MNGKGDTARPLSVSQDTFAERWERTFARKKGLADLVGEIDTTPLLGLGERHVFVQGNPPVVPPLCPTCKGEGRDPDHPKNGCPTCDTSGRLPKQEEAA